jgi:hypothetical protein
MSLNVAINGLLGSIPLIGDLFSVWFHSNVRNVELLERHGGERRASTVWDWLFVMGLFAALIGVFVAAVAGVIWLVEVVRRSVQ